MRICSCGGIVKEHSLIEKRLALTCLACGRYEVIDDIGLDLSATKEEITDAGFTFIFNKSIANRAHIFTGEDTVCRMLSTGGFTVKDTTIASDDCGERGICMMCQNVFYRHKHYGKPLRNTLKKMV